MGFIYTTIAEYDEEITYVREQIRKAVKAEEWQLDTSQSRQRVRQNLKEMRLYLNQLVTERTIFAQRAAGGGVTSIVVRRSY